MKIHSLLYLLQERLLWCEPGSQAFWAQDFVFRFLFCSIKS